MMLEIQRNVYIWEGSINKLMVDDKVCEPAVLRSNLHLLSYLLHI